ncbi:TetR/AcrR family transcriptional regulator [Microbacterium sp. EYE_5]|uniref:TetR/AcrR family transcriptional regulator n=1 Tax=unclassified Microbacterium TaxID=2609290 RepID=UPI0020069894|nr:MULTISPECIES: TetR/AcrR family transcriptional regulator [unclassified Microbacterium]MCK6080045.1 TetR/AcrR family transcriptional regulator [Microbacterium sp. EYE_382]MCK6085316.1 TetR/AcrR family transcriptional regulator [Microbacterium sp. EYE_384]MCK6122459.1 TetR/AcrR family transcriptional regulator [Microbacterium sp. EYE_80]MCK6126079.1 TetR/AcrR family transcriptional regulator [Microbacterium sp. EYE_79]MCK6141000.1 TetR/AcrR family transcriptional regulator [Microbacterium sp.
MDTTIDRDRIVTAADELFYGRGIQSVGMDEVRAAAGLSLKRVYAAFSSKEQLVLAVLERRRGIWDDGIAAASAGATTPRERLLAVYDFLDAWFREDDFRGCGFINSFGELGAVMPSVAAVVDEQKSSFHGYLADLVDELGAPRRLASQLALLAEGAQTTAAISHRPEVAADARAAAESLIDLALVDSRSPTRA